MEVVHNTVIHICYTIGGKECLDYQLVNKNSNQKFRLPGGIHEGTYAIFSEGERQGISSSISSSLSSPSSPSSLPAMLKDDEVNMSGTGSMEGLRLPAGGKTKSRSAEVGLDTRQTYLCAD